MTALSHFPNKPYKIVRIYLKGASSEVPNMSRVAQQIVSPHIGVDMRTLGSSAGPGRLECVLSITLHAQLEGKTIFLIEVSEAGIFELDVDNLEDGHRFVRKIAPSVLFPFARKDLASLAIAAGFQPVLLDHIDFDAILAQTISSQRATRPSVERRLDFIAAKPATPVAFDTSSEPVLPLLATALPLPESVSSHLESTEILDPDGVDTQLAHAHAVVDIALTGKPEQIFAGPENQVQTAIVRERDLLRPTSPWPSLLIALISRNKLKRLNKISALLGIMASAAVIAWWIAPKSIVKNQLTLAHNSSVKAKNSVPGLETNQKLALPVLPSPVASAATLQAIKLSQQRLAEQPPNWFTIDLGFGPVDQPIEARYPQHTDTDGFPMFVKAAKTGSIQLFYGVFPSRDAAEQVKKSLAQPASVVMISSL